MHVLLELGHGLASPDLEDVSNVAPRAYTEKPMADSDFNRIERELIHQIHPTQGLRSMVYYKSCNSAISKNWKEYIMFKKIF